MAVYIKVATTAAERDALFRTRHRVYVEQSGLMRPRPDMRIYDRFDAFPTTTNIIALMDEQVIGGARLTELDEDGVLADQYFDFAPHLPPGETRVGSVSMLCLNRDYQHRERLMSCMADMLYCLATRRRLTHIIAPVHSEFEGAFLRAGYRQVAPTFSHPGGSAVSPMIIDICDIETQQIRLVNTHGAPLLHSFERAFHAPGELVIREGEPGQRAYVILDGEATAGGRCKKSGRLHRSRLRPGELFGHVSVLAGRPYRRTVEAATELELMMFDAKALHEQLRACPDKAIALLQSLGNRLIDTLTSDRWNASLSRSVHE